jgi:AcrR family transcriptional regulator
MTRLNPTIRRETILAAALILARREGYNRISRETIADAARCAPPLVSYYFGTIVQLRRAIMGEAIRVRDYRVIGQGIVARDSRALGVSDEMKDAAIRAISL